MQKKTAYRKLRDGLGLTQEELAAPLGLTRQRWGQLEGGGQTLSASKLLALQKKHGRSIKRLGLSIEDFLGGSR